MVAFDTSTIVLSIDPDSLAPLDPSTGERLTRAKERVDYLLQRLNQTKDGILIPTPVLSEFLVKAGPNKHEFLEKLIASRNFTVGSFDERAAIELALLNDPDLNSGKKLDEKATKA